MTKRILRSVLFVGTTIALFSFDLPVGWIKAGSDPDKYEMGIDKCAGQDGENAATIKSIDKKISKSGFGTLMQECKPDKYLGKRIRMSGYIKTKDVSNWSGFWLRIDQKDSENSLSFDNMHDGKTDRSIKGTTNWKKYEIVLDVPTNASLIAFGALISGTGQIWFDNITFEVVDTTVETTEYSNGIQNEPFNLDFEK